MKFVPGANDNDLDQLTDLFQLLSDKTRMKVLLLLADGERNVTALCQSLALPQPTVSHHLGLLRIHNVIGNRRKGKQVFYFLNGTVSAGPGESLNLSLERLAVNIHPKSD
jgi:DNA-binding transcriptional ArsR family regulator